MRHVHPDGSRSLRTRLLRMNLLLALTMPCAATENSPSQMDRFSVGIGSAIITPPEPMWAGGYANRTEPIRETLQDLYAKAMLIRDGQGHHLLIITTDLLGFPRSLSAPLRERLAQLTGVPMEAIVLSSSHTHCGPVLRESLAGIYPMQEADWEVVKKYSAWLPDRIVDAVTQAMSHAEPCRLRTGIGKATFAINRRENVESQVVAGYKPKGPVDHDVPVLVAEDLNGRVKAILCGYACHNTTMNFYKWCGDYAGFTQRELERSHPGAIAMFAQACGGDSNPLPRRKIELCEDYGRQLARAVDQVIEGPMSTITGSLAAAYKEVDLALDHIPDRAGIQSLISSTDRARSAYGKRLLADLERGPLRTTYPYPVQALQLGRQLTIIALGGEVVVDYSLRLKKELGPATWVLAYNNDVMAYIPSRRVLAEGGYEGARSMEYYGLPGLWAPSIEDRIVQTSHKLVSTVRATTQPAS